MPYNALGGVVRTLEAAEGILGTLKTIRGPIIRAIGCLRRLLGYFQKSFGGLMRPLDAL